MPMATAIASPYTLVVRYQPWVTFGIYVMKMLIRTREPLFFISGVFASAYHCAGAWAFDIPPAYLRRTV